MRDIRSIGIAVFVIAINAVAFYQFGFRTLTIPMFMMSLLLVLEATPDPT